MSVDIKAIPHIDGNIEIDVKLTDEETKQAEYISREIMKTKDKVTQDALVALGWTPPNGEAPIIADVNLLVDAIIGKGFRSEKHHKNMIVYGWATNRGWNREVLQGMKPAKLLGIYTEGSLIA